MAQGEITARQNHHLRLVEAVAGQLDNTASPVYAIDLNTDGNGFDNLQRFLEHKPDGFNSILGAALVGDEGQIGGRFMPHYESMRYLCPRIAGPVFSTTPLPDGRTMRKWKLPEFGRVNRQTFSGYYGVQDDALVLLYGKIQALSIETARGGEVGGNMTEHYNRVFSRSAAMPDATLRPAVLLGGPYMEPDHLVVYKADDWADLNSIPMGITQDEFDDDLGPDLTDDHVIKTAMAASWGADALVNPVYFHDRQKFPASHVDADGNYTMSVTVPKDVNGRCEEIYSTEEGCAVTPFYMRHAYKCGPREFWIDMYSGRNNKPDFPVENNIAQRQFPLVRFHNPNGSLWLTLITPN